MKIIKKIYHFIGGITFAITLLTITALTVIIGTFIESLTDSHKYAATFTYSSPFFALLLWGFFANILISALRRWPFKTKHIPFLITHLGLLMIISGCIIKNGYGIQGNISIMEGSGGHHLHLPDTYSINIERRDRDNLDRVIAKHFNLSGDPSQFIVAEVESGKDNSQFHNLNVKVLDCISNCSEKWDTWFKGDYAYLYGLPPFPVKKLRNDDTDPLKPETFYISEDDEIPWHFYGIRHSDPDNAIKRVLAEAITVHIKNRLTEEELSTSSLSEALSNKGRITAEISPPKAVDDAIEPLLLTLQVETPHHPGTLKAIFPLNGERSLENQTREQLSIAETPIVIEISAQPTVAFIEDDEGDFTYIAISNNGCVKMQKFPEGKSDSLLVYDEGFGGYSVHAPLPDLKNRMTSEDVEKAKIYNLSISLREALTQENSLANPLDLLKNACRKAETDFVETVILYLDAWNRSERLIVDDTLPLPVSVKFALTRIDWASIPKNHLKGCLWGYHILEAIQNEIFLGHSFINALEKLNWPLMERIKTLQNNPINKSDENLKLLNEALIHQLFLVANQLPDIPMPESLSPGFSGGLLSIYLKLFSISMEDILPQLSDDSLKISKEKLLLASLFSEELNEAFPPFREMHLKQKITFATTLPEKHPFKETLNNSFKRYFKTELPSLDSASFAAVFPTIPVKFNANSQKILSENLDKEPLFFESAITPKYQKQPPSKKLEDNIALLLLSVSNGKHKENVAVPFDPHGTRFKWPMLNGEYRLRFEQKSIELPYHLRLRTARQINYANSQQPFCYECDLLITDRETGSTIEKTLSMNNVYESKDGYRFYLAAISPSDEGKVKKVQIVVNYDPAKYFLTYPGGIIIAIGIVSLFWMHSKRKNPKNR